MFGSSRGGVRGGQDQFSWEDVKTDKQRENYLGERGAGAEDAGGGRGRGGLGTRGPGTQGAVGAGVRGRVGPGTRGVGDTRGRGRGPSPRRSVPQETR